jgi:hypothetical protein
MDSIDETNDPTPSADPAGEPEPSSDGASANTGVPDATGVHNTLKAVLEVENGAVLVRLRCLRALYEFGLYLYLGYPTLEMYCDRELGMGRSTALECVRVGYALDGLPRLRLMFGAGELSWEQVRAITRVATAETELAWIDVAFEVSVRTLVKKVAQSKTLDLDTPPPNRFQLPNVRSAWSARFTLEEQERLETALELVAKAIPPEEGDRRHPLIRLSDAVLAGKVQVGGESTNGRSVPAQTILYRTCPECRMTTVDTSAGPVAVDPDRVEELAPSANRVVIHPDEEVPAESLPPGEVDAPNSARLTRQVLHRDGLECANPLCSRKIGLQAHHVQFRSRGGPSALSNEVTVCGRCHAAIHAGLLDVSGTPEEGLKWKARPLDPAAQVCDVDALQQKVRELEAEMPPPPSGDRRVPGSPPEEDLLNEGRIRDIVDSLVSFKWGRKASDEMVRRAIVDLIHEQRQSPDWTGTPRVPTDEEIIEKVLRSAGGAAAPYAG